MRQQSSFVPCCDVSLADSDGVVTVQKEINVAEAQDRGEWEGLQKAENKSSRAY